MATGVEKRGKRYKAAATAYDRTRLYDPAEAVRLVKANARAKFDETIEVAVRLGVDVRHADQQVRGTVVLPHGTGRKVRVLVFARGEKAREAEQAGADVVGAEDLVEKITGGWLEFDTAVATPDVMNIVGRLGRILGPRGLMPNPKAGTVTFDVTRAVRDSKAGKIEFRTDKFGLIHAPIGKASFSEEALAGNFEALIGALQRGKPAAAKGQYFRTITVSSTMGPGVRVDPAQAVGGERE